MLKELRRQMKAIFWVVIVAFVITIFYWGAGTYRARRRNVLASVNGEEISLEEFYTSWQQAAENYRQIYGKRFSQEMVRDLSRPVLESLIQKKIFLQEARRRNIQIHDGEIRTRIESYPVFQREGKFDRNLYLDVLSYYRLPPTQFEQTVRENLVLERLDNLIRDGVKISDREIWNEYVRENEEIRVSYIYFPKSRFRETVTVREEEISNYYQNNQEEFRLPERVRARHILISPGPEDTEEARTKARQKAEDVLAQLKKGADFSDLAKKYSDDPASRTKGGDLGYFSRQDMEPTFVETAFALKEIGEISELVETSYGYHIIQLLEKKPTEIPPLENVKEQIYNRLLNEQVRLATQTRATEIWQQIKTGRSFEKAALDNGGSIDTGFFKYVTALKNLGFAREFKDVAYALKIGEISPVVEVSDGFCLIRLEDRRPVNEEKFQQEKVRLKEALRQQREYFLYQEWYLNLRSKAKIVDNLEKFLEVE